MNMEGIKWKYLFGLIVLFGLGALTVFMSMPKKNKIIDSYEINQDVNYTVSIYKNNLYETDKLFMDQTYVSSLVKDIELDYSYNYNHIKKTPLKYQYKIVANLYGDYVLPSDDKKSRVWTKEISLFESDWLETNNDALSFSKGLKINYKEYETLFLEARSELNLPISGVLSIDLTINILSDGKEVTSSMNVNFPLNQQAFKINTNYEKHIAKDIFKYDEEALNGNKMFLINGILLILVSGIIFVFFIKDILGLEKLNYYEKNLKKILKLYGDIIVEVKYEIDKKGLNATEVKSFDEMLDLASELRFPIIFWEKSKGVYGEFTLVHGKVLYKYILKNK